MTLYELEPGTEVILKTDQLYEQPKRLQQMVGRVFVGESCHTLNGIRLYTLKGCCSKAGEPYTIMGAWITPTRPFRR